MTTSTTLRLTAAVNDREFEVLFTGTPEVVDATAVDYAERRGAILIAEDDDCGLDPALHPRTHAKVFPICEHGLSEWLCHGPSHYGYDF